MDRIVFPDQVHFEEAGKAFEIDETQASKNGWYYSAANGSPIKNYGQRSLTGFTDEGFPMEAAVQIAEVKRNLASAMKIVKAGNRIVLDEAGSYIEDKKTGRAIQVQTENGDFQFEIWVPKPAAGIEGKSKNQWEQMVKTNKFENFNGMDIDNDEEGDAMLETVFIGQD